MSNDSKEALAGLCLLALLGAAIFACVAGRHGCGQKGSLEPGDRTFPSKATTTTRTHGGVK